MPAAATSASIENSLAWLADARARTDRLFGVVRDAHLYDRPIPERHRIVFYVGHLEAFDWNLLREAVHVRAPWRPDFDRLFAFGIDPVGGGLPTDGPEDWPAIEEVRRYDAEIREALDAGLGSAMRAASAAERQSLDRRLNVAIEHRLMHEETLCYMFHRLPYERKNRWEQAATPIPLRAMRPEMLEIPAGVARMGLRRDGGARFGWDNEFEAHEVNVPAFRMDRFMVTNGEFLGFVETGGYARPEFWTEEDWRWISAAGVRHPAFWNHKQGEWHWRGMFEEISLPLDWPVYVSHAEAAAYARWVRKSLPSEAQWQRAAYGESAADERAFPWGNGPASAQRGNFDFGRFDPAPVHAWPESRGAFGVEGMIGNGWEWTSSRFAPFPGFEPFSFYPGYSANFFDGKHFTMKGGSPRTALSMLRPSFRNWFQAYYPYVYAGFRCVSA